MKEAKAIRSQVRQVAKEILPELLGQEFTSALEKRLVEQFTEQLNRIEKRQKELQMWIIRQESAK